MLLLLARDGTAACPQCDQCTVSAYTRRRQLRDAARDAAAAAAAMLMPRSRRTQHVTCTRSQSATVFPPHITPSPLSLSPWLFVSTSSSISAVKQAASFLRHIAAVSTRQRRRSMNLTDQQPQSTGLRRDDRLSSKTTADPTLRAYRPRQRPSPPLSTLPHVRRNRNKIKTKNLS